MYTILLEIKNKKSHHIDFYNPAVDECKAYPRTQEGIKRAIKKFKAFLATHNEDITAAQIILYSGKYEYHKKDMQPIQVYSI